MMREENNGRMFLTLMGYGRQMFILNQNVCEVATFNQTRRRFSLSLPIKGDDWVKSINSKRLYNQVVFEIKNSCTFEKWFPGKYSIRSTFMGKVHVTFNTRNNTLNIWGYKSECSMFSVISLPNKRPTVLNFPKRIDVPGFEFCKFSHKYKKSESYVLSGGDCVAYVGYMKSWLNPKKELIHEVCDYIDFFLDSKSNTCNHCIHLDSRKDKKIYEQYLNLLED